MEGKSQDPSGGNWIKPWEPSPDYVLPGRLREVRQQAGLTQQQLADLMTGAGYRMRQTTIAKIEAGERAVSVGEGYTLATVLGADLDVLLTPQGDDAEHTRRVQALGELRAAEEEAMLRGEEFDMAEARLEAARERLKTAQQQFAEVTAAGKRAATRAKGDR